MPGFFGNNRWTYFRLTNHSHNTLVIDGQLQNTSAKSKVTAYHSSPERASAVIDMTDAYKGQADSVRRGFEMLNRQAVYVQDEIEGAVGAVRWARSPKPKLNLAETGPVLRQDGQTLVAQIVEPAAARLQVLPTKASYRERSPERRHTPPGHDRPTARRKADDDSCAAAALGRPASRSLPAKPLNEWPGYIKSAAE